MALSTNVMYFKTQHREIRLSFRQPNGTHPSFQVFMKDFDETKWHRRGAFSVTEYNKAVDCFASAIQGARTDALIAWKKKWGIS